MSDGKLFIDQIMALKATVNYTDGSNDGTVTWKSSDPTVASVTNSGILTGISGGVATISATSVWPDVDGNNIVDEKTLVVEGKVGFPCIYTFDYSGSIGTPPTSSSTRLYYDKGTIGELVPDSIDWPEFAGEPLPYIDYLRIDQFNTNTTSTAPDIDIILLNLRAFKNYRIKFVLGGVVSFVINGEADSYGKLRSTNEHSYIDKESFAVLTENWTVFTGTMECILISEW